jgi:deoxyribodipyrimidine photo-lyase
MKAPINIVWFKKDLRINDHEALQKAVDSRQKLLLIYIFEPSLLTAPDSDLCHWRLCIIQF